VADPRVAGFAGDRGSPSDMLSPVAALSRILRRRTTVFGSCTCTSSAYAMGQSRASFGRLDRHFRHALGRCHLLPHVMERIITTAIWIPCSPSPFCYLVERWKWNGTNKSAHQHSQVWRRLRRSSQSIRPTDSRGRGSAPLLLRGEIPGSGRSSGTGHPRGLYLARPSPPYHKCQKG
jgi:hypothetical protein